MEECSVTGQDLESSWRMLESYADRRAGQSRLGLRGKDCLTGLCLFFSEPHQPHLMLEAGSLSSAEYEAQVRARHDFQRLQQRDSDGERQVRLCKAKLWCWPKLYVRNRSRGGSGACL